MKKKFIKILSRAMNSPVAKVIFYILVIEVLLVLYSTAGGIDAAWNEIFGILKSEVTVSVFFAGLVSILVTQIVKMIDIYLEESLKISDNHHDIINKYNKHKKRLRQNPDTEAKNVNFADEIGVQMAIRKKHVGIFGRKDTQNTVSDHYSEAYTNMKNALTEYEKEGTLYLPSINMFTNTTGKTDIVFEDTNQQNNTPAFILENAMNLMAAHKNSVKNNTNTIRLKDFSYEDNVLTLKTMRSTYFHMLFTNRCMDYEFKDDMTLRKIYEYGSEITPLAQSPFGNQIGINGLIITSDGYVLIEKRDHKKITWKDKFAQSISLAMKESTLRLNDNHEMDGDYESANENLRKIITKTIKDNYGLKEIEDYDAFDIRTNFLGLARDLLEGGKPNLYFYVVMNKTAKELAERLKEVAKRDEKHEDKEKDEKALKTEKLSSDYYLVPYEDIKINFHYVMKLDRTKCIRVRRHVYPRSKWIVSAWEAVRHFCSGRFDRDYRKECGEAFLVTMSYLELCESRIDVLSRKNKKNGK